MKTTGVCAILTVLLLYTCNSDVTFIRGEVEGMEGEVALYMLDPVVNDTILVDKQEVKEGKFVLEGRMKLPARLWLKKEGEYWKELIVDSKDKICIEGSVSDSGKVEVKGAVLEDEYRLFRQWLEEKYEVPIAEMKNIICKLEQKEALNGREENMLANYRRRVEKYERYRFESIKKLVKANSEHELSLFLLWDELQDSVNVQKELFSGMTVENKKSNIYRLLMKRLQ